MVRLSYTGFPPAPEHALKNRSERSSYASCKKYALTELNFDQLLLVKHGMGERSQGSISVCCVCIVSSQFFLSKAK